MALYFQRDTTLRVYPNKADGTRNNAADDAFVIPVLEGFSFSQTTNSSEVTISEMESTGGTSRRGRKSFNDSLAPVEWSFSTYLRPFLSSTATTAGVVGGPATSEAIAIAATLYSASARTLYIRLKPLANNLATAATTVTYLIEFLHLGVLPD